MKYLISILFIAATGCKAPDYVYYSDPKPAQVLQVDQALRSLDESSLSKVDILWVIDNSGSMDVHQRKVINNAALFIDQFTQNNRVDWRMGMISSDRQEAPFLGLSGNAGLNPRFDSKTPRPIQIFNDAVMRLGLYGSGTEEFFLPTLNSIDSDRTFIREQAYLILFFVTDAPEQSPIQSDEFLRRLNVIKGNPRWIRMYGAFEATDLGCEGTAQEGPLRYKNSKFVEVIQATGGRALPLCDAEFGKELAKIAKDIVELVERPRVYLDQRPKAASIKVTYQGRALAGGPAEDGGLWYYDYQLNAVVFYSLEFAPTLDERVTVTFEVDNGLPIAIQ